ncbi:hypothetical protein DICVIV_04505 [Dictyocaulus viviparus]|uniref:Hexosyltransferase n=1 Tax=Dictyocaulus viviparus TaxID=29172 RepID=A0A0D8XXZ4_DICVI|nr:hypothetical protein DICVIV_04505 [Dictyocaulus viviparus]
MENEEMLATEEKEFHDIVVADIDEGYYSLSMKTYAMLYFKTTRYRMTKCLVKADSDNVLLIRNYERLCDETSMLKTTCLSYVIDILAYCIGYCKLRMLPEDVLFTGIFAEKAGIRRTHTDGMSFIDAPEYICRDFKHTYSIHMNRVQNPKNYFKRLISMEGESC